MRFFHLHSLIKATMKLEIDGIEIKMVKGWKNLWEKALLQPYKIQRVEIYRWCQKRRFFFWNGLL